MMMMMNSNGLEAPPMNGMYYDATAAGVGGAPYGGYDANAPSYGGGYGYDANSGYGPYGGPAAAPMMNPEFGGGGDHYATRGAALATQGGGQCVPVTRGATVILQATVPCGEFNALQFAEEVVDAYNADPTKGDMIAAGNVQIIGIRPSADDPNGTDVNVTITTEQIPVMLTRAGRAPRRTAGRPSLLRRFTSRLAGIGFDSVVGGIFSGLLGG